jgi:hypothetical protein
MLVTAGTVATVRLVFSGFDPEEVVDPEDVEPPLLHPAIVASARPAPPASMPRREIAFAPLCHSGVMHYGGNRGFGGSSLVPRDGVSPDTETGAYDLTGVSNQEYFRHTRE